MAVSKEDVDLVKDLLWENENVQITVKQRRIGPGGSVITPTSVVATDMRIIIVNKATLGIRKDYEVIPYKQIASVRLEKGIISSTVFVRVQGYDKDKGLLKGKKEEGEIDGLRNNDAVALSDYLNKRISENAERLSGANGIAAAVGTYCTSCGASNMPGAKFCNRCGKPMQQ